MLWNRVLLANFVDSSKTKIKSEWREKYPELRRGIMIETNEHKASEEKHQLELNDQEKERGTVKRICRR